MNEAYRRGWGWGLHICMIFLETFCEYEENMQPSLLRDKEASVTDSRERSSSFSRNPLSTSTKVLLVLLSKRYDNPVFLTYVEKLVNSTQLVEKITSVFPPKKTHTNKQTKKHYFKMYCTWLSIIYTPGNLPWRENFDFYIIIISFEIRQTQEQIFSLSNY